MNKTSTFLTMTAVIMLTMTSADAGRKPQQLVEPNYTKGEVLTDKWNLNVSALGSTGATGNVWDGGGGPRMIQIRSVEEGSPADGVLQKGDVILGIGNGKFTSDARRAISAAITQAETKEGAGKLTLNVYRPEGDPKLGKGETMLLTIELPVLGRFSESAPWECDKTKRLINMAAESIAKDGFFTVPQKAGKKGKGIKEEDALPPEPKQSHSTWLAALGLLATGEEKYLPMVRDYVRAIGKPDIDLDWKTPQKVSWTWGYKNLLLCEYYLATKDDYVLPAIKEFSTEIAKGASDVGTFGHRMSYYYTVDGVEQKYPPGYGAMNQCSITCALSLVLAQKCGVKDPEVAKVIEKSRKFYRWYVDKGTIPYGDHGPVTSAHDNNGVNSQVAVMFDLLGDKEAARYFTRMTLASYKIRERGHTGHFFSWQWGALGAARGGTEAAQSFARNTRWFTELERRANGESVYQPQLANQDHGKYRYWSTTGSRLLQHCLPLKKLYITGKGGSCFEPIIGNELEECVAAGQFDPKSCSVEQLLGFLGSWSPIVRAQAAVELGTREADVSRKLVAMLDNPDSRVQCGACLGLQYAGRGSVEAVDKMINLLATSDDKTLRYTVCGALARPRPGRDEFKAGLGDAVLKAGPALLKQAATYEPETDPMRKLHFMLSSTLFYGGTAANTIGYYPSGEGSEKIDPALKVAVVRSLLRNPNGRARSNVSGLFSSLSPQELEQLWGDIHAASKYQAPSGSMFAGGVRGNGIAIMAKHHVKEGIEVGFHWTFVQEGWGDGGRKWRGVPALKPYGLAAADHFPLFEKQIEDYQKPNGKGKTDPNKLAQAKEWQKQLDEMKTMTAPKLISIQSHIEKVNPKEFYSIELKK